MKTEKNEKDWIQAVSVGARAILFGPDDDVLLVADKDAERFDFCSPKCANEYTADLLGWKKIGRPKGSKNRTAPKPGVERPQSMNAQTNGGVAK